MAASVLVVEDNEVLRLAALHGADAVARFIFGQDYRLDVSMLVLDGLEATRQIRELEPVLPASNQSSASTEPVKHLHEGNPFKNDDPGTPSTAP